MSAQCRRIKRASIFTPFTPVLGNVYTNFAFFLGPFVSNLVARIARNGGTEGHTEFILFVLTFSILISQRIIVCYILKQRQKDQCLT